MIATSSRSVPNPSLERQLLRLLLLGPALLAGLALSAPPAAAAVTVADGWSHRRWGPEHGLPVVGVNAVTQDESGFLWLATFDGLVRFDGIHFTTVEPGTRNPPASERFTSLRHGRYGSLWLTTETLDLVRFDLRRWDYAPDGVEKPRPSGAEARVIRRGPEGDLIFGVGADLFREGDQGVASAVATLDAASIRSAAFSPTGDLLLGTLAAGLFRAVPGEPPERVPGIPDDSEVSAVLADEDGVVWVGTHQGLWRVFGGGVEPVSLAVGPGLVLRLETRSEGGIWAVVGPWLHSVDEHGSAMVSEQSPFTGSEPIELRHEGDVWLNTGRRLLHNGREVLRADSMIKDLHVDHEGSLWVATAADGLHRLRPSAFQVIDLGDRPPPSIYPVVEGAGGEIWLGILGGGVARVQGSEVERFFDPECSLVWSLLPVGSDEVLVGSLGLWRLREGRFEPRELPESARGAAILALFRDSRERLWVGTLENGLLRRGPDGAWWHLPPGREGLPNAPVRAFLESRDGAIWIGTNGGGLLRWREDALERLSRAEGFPSDLVRVLWEDDAGAIWAGTENQGVVRIVVPAGAPLASAAISPVGPSHGLCDRGIHQILPDGLGRLWMSTNRGIFRVQLGELSAVADRRLEALHCVNFTEAHGLPAREANGGVQSPGTRASDGRLWFPTVAGAVVIDPGALAESRVPPPVVIEGVLPAGGRQLLRLQPGEGTLRLGPRERTFEVSYHALSFVEPERVRFRYRLEGLTEEWIDARDQRRVQFTDLGPGTYRFQVIAANEQGFWNKEGAALTFEVAPLWWETLWVRGGTAGAVLALTLVGVGLRGARRRRRHRELEAMVEARTSELADALQQVQLQAEELRDLDAAKSRFFAHMSHELRTPLTLLLGPLLEADEAPDRLRAELPLMQRSAQALQRLVDQILDLEKAGAGGLELHREPRNLGALARRVVDAFAGLAERREVALELEEVAPGAVSEIDAERTEQVLANLVSNALKFTPAGGSVTLRVVVAGEWVEIEVRDTGRGIPASAASRVFDRFYQVESEHAGKRGTGLGLAFSREVVELHGGRIEVASELGHGSTFRVSLPRSNAVDAAAERERGAAERRLPAPVPSPGTTSGPEPSRGVLGPLSAEEDQRQTVLVVEDHHDISRYIERLFAQTYRTLVAADGPTGLALARRNLPDLVVADIGLPEMDGLEMCRRLRSDPETASIPLLFLTARVTRVDERAGFASGAVAYVRKPFDAATLLVQAASLLDQQRRLRRRLQEVASGALSQAAEAEPAGLRRPDGGTEQGRGGLRDQACEVIAAHLYQDEFGPGGLARALAVGRSELFRRFREELGTTPAELIRAVRLERARELLEQGAGSVSEVAYAVGFASLSSFGRAYRAHYGEAPSAALVRPAARSRRGMA